MSEKCPKCGWAMAEADGTGVDEEGAVYDCAHAVDGPLCRDRQLVAMTAERDGLRAVVEAAKPAVGEDDDEEADDP